MNEWNSNTNEENTIWLICISEFLHNRSNNPTFGSKQQGRMVRWTNSDWVVENPLSYEQWSFVVGCGVSFQSLQPKCCVITLFLCRNHRAMSHPSLPSVENPPTRRVQMARNNWYKLCSQKWLNKNFTTIYWSPNTGKYINIFATDACDQTFYVIFGIEILSVHWGFYILMIFCHWPQHLTSTPLAN